MRDGVRLPKSDHVGEALRLPGPEAETEAVRVSDRVDELLGVTLVEPVLDLVLLGLSEAAPGQRVMVGVGEMPVDCVLLSVGLCEKIGLSLPVSLALPLALGLALGSALGERLSVELALPDSLGDDE